MPRRPSPLLWLLLAGAPAGALAQDQGVEAELPPMVVEASKAAATPRESVPAALGVR